MNAERQLAEFKLTSKYSELIQLAEERNSSTEITGIREIAPSIHRVARLRGRVPLSSDIPDVCYDLSNFVGVTLSPSEVKERFSKLISCEAGYYKLAENIAIKNAKDFGFYDRLDDFIDLAKDTVSRTVWINWKPERGESFVDLHKRVVGILRRHLVFLWGRNNPATPASYFPDEICDEGIPFQNLESFSPAEKPIFRLQHAAKKLPLPAIIAVIEKGGFTEQIAPLTLMEYYPSKDGLNSVASAIGVKRETLSTALDRTLARFNEARKSDLPKKSIQEIVYNLKVKGVMKYPSGKNIKFDNPRLMLINNNLTDVESLPRNLSERDRSIIELASLHSNNSLKYSTEEIARIVGSSYPVVCRVIKKAAERTCF